MRICWNWAFVLTLSVCSATRAQSQAADLRGIYVDSNAFPISKASSTALAASLTVPGVDGLVLVLGWAGIEPGMGQYQWDTLDQWMSMAVSSGRKVELSVRADLAPAWLFQPAPGGAGATPLSFTYAAQAGAKDCQSETIAAPWDPAFLTQWDAMLAAVAAHLRSAGTYNAIPLLRLTGINRNSDELHLPAQTPESVSSPCVSDSVATWMSAGYRPSLLLHGWDGITTSFKKSFPDKYFSVAIIDSSNPFPPIAEDGSVITFTSPQSLSPSQNMPLLMLASQKFPGHLIIQNNSLYPGVPAEPETIQFGQSLGTLTAFQTNEVLGGTGGGAACGAPQETTPCTAATFLQMLETGIYPLGKSNGLRAQYIEVFPANVNAFPDDTLQAHLELLANEPFTIADRGGVSFTSSGAGSSIAAGYARIQPNTGSGTPTGVAIFSYRVGNILVSEAGVPATPALTAGRIYAEIAGPLDAGLAIANPNSSAATIDFYFTDVNGNPAGSGSTTIAANQQKAQFLDQSPFKVYTTPTFQGTFTFTSSVPIAVVALRGLTNERGEFLMSTLPVIDITAAPNTGTAVVPHFADGGGWTTQVLLVNATDNPMAGTLQFENPTGTATTVTIGVQTNSSFAYSIPKRTSQKLATSGLTPATATGSIRIVPSAGAAGPTPLVVFSFKPAGVTVSEAGVPVTIGSAFRVYVESSGVPGQTGNIDSGIAVANTSQAAANVTFDVTELTGASVAGVAPVTITMPGSGQLAQFLSSIFPSLPNPFKGSLRITTTSSGISVVGLRIRMNERGDFLITTTPPSNENSPPTGSALYFPQVADGGGYTTQFILFSGTAGPATSGNLQLFMQNGSAFGLPLN